MNFLLYCLYILLPCYPLEGVETPASRSKVIWEGFAAGGFVAQIAVSDVHLDINKSLKVHLKLTFPTNYHPRLGALRSHLLAYGGLGQPPFSLSKETIHPPIQHAEGTNAQQLDYVLSPQLPGKHFLSFQQILFEPNQAGSDSPVTLITEVFDIDVMTHHIDFQPQIFIEPVMPLTQELLLRVNFANREHYVRNSLLARQAAEQARIVMQSKALPWLGMLTLSVMAVVAWLIYAMPPPKRAPKNSVLDIAQLRLKLLKNLETLPQRQWIEEGKYGLYFSSLDQAIRTYVQAAYNFDALSSTTPECVHQVTLNPRLDAKSKLNLINFLQLADQVKFAHQQPSPAECEDALQTAKQLLSLEA